VTDLDTREIARVADLMESGKPTTIFVFGSNLAGAHGGGAARVAFRQYGAAYGKAEGPSGRSYAIPTMDEHIESLPLESVEAYVAHFLGFARSRPDLRFAVTRIGCGIAGFDDADIAPLFRDAPANCDLPEGWQS
jgi:hypothetical protein